MPESPQQIRKRFDGDIFRANRFRECDQHRMRGPRAARVNQPQFLLPSVEQLNRSRRRTNFIAEIV